MSVNSRWILINSISILLQLCFSVYGAIKGPSQIEGFVGGNARFLWNTTDGKKILTATWGLRNGEMANPQFINVNAFNNKPRLNLNMPEHYVGRVQFIGDLQAGRAWFMIKNLTIQDSNEYTASIADDEVGGLSSYHVRLKVKNSIEDSAPTPTQPSTIVTSSSKTNITLHVTNTYLIITAPLLKTTPSIDGTIVKETKGTKSTPSDHDRRYNLTMILVITFASIFGCAVIMLICYVIIIFTKKKKVKWIQCIA